MRYGTQGDLSSHLTKLEEAGLVRIEKTFVGKRPNTNIALTPVGKERIGAHISTLCGRAKVEERSVAAEFQGGKRP